MDNINKLVFQLSIVKKITYIYAIVLIFILISGSYYLISSNISNYIETYFKNHLTNKKSNIYNNLYIIHFIIKFFVFFNLLKFIIKTILDLIFIDLDNPDCKLQSYIEKISKITSITFFIVYEIVLFPLNLINSLEKLFIVSEKFILEHFKPDININLETLEKTLEKDAKSIRDDLTYKLELFYNNLSSSIDAWYIKVFIYIEEKYFKKDNNKNNEKNINHVASSYAGFVSLKILIIGLIYIGLYFIFKDSPMIRLILFIIIVFLFIRHLINSFIFKMATNQVIFIKEFTELFSKKSFNSTNSKHNLKGDLKQFSKDIKPLVNPLMHLLFKQKKSKKKLLQDKEVN